MTEQGEVIADRYGHPGIAERHLEQVINAVLRTSFPARGRAARARLDRGILDRLAEPARRHYRALVYETPEFLDLLPSRPRRSRRSSQLKIGSRPARRGKSTAHRPPPGDPLGLQLDAVPPHPPRLVRPRRRGRRVPRRATRRRWRRFQEMYRRWPFWRTLIDNAQMILAKADMTIARLYADLVDDPALADADLRPDRRRVRAGPSR